MPKKKLVRNHVPNPSGKGGFDERPQDRGGGRGHKKPIVGVSGCLYADMKRAYTTDETPEDSGVVKALRRLAHSDPVKFMLEYNKAAAKASKEVPVESGPLLAVASGTPSTPVVGSVGPKEVAVEELAEKLLAEWERAEVSNGFVEVERGTSNEEAHSSGSA